MKKILLSLLTIAIVVSATFSTTMALFSDEEVSEGNTFTASTLDLTVNGENNSLSYVYEGENLVPGNTVNAGTVALTNNGDTPGKLILKISNPNSNENGLFEPEETDGDVDGSEIDPTGYDENSGDGELWDMSTIKLYVDSDNNGSMRWNEPVIWGGQHVDMTSHYSIPLDTDLGTEDLAHGFDGTIQPGETVYVGLLVTFKTDSQLASQPQYNGLTNNMGMSDDLSFDVIFGLEQITE